MIIIVLLYLGEEMFGYIRTDTPELRVRENEYYRAVYCGLCRAQGKCTGQCSRMTLSYDVAFLALLRIAIEGKPTEIKRGRCIAHPLRARKYVARCAPLDYCSYAAAILTYGKIVDDINDEHGFKKFKAALMKPMAQGMRRKALKNNYAELDRVVCDGLKKLSDIEKQELKSVDIPADAFGEILAEIMSYGLEGTNRTIMYNIGKHVGRWIYIVDAADDLDEDIKKGRYNAFALLYGGAIPKEQLHSVSDSLRLELLAAEPMFDLLDYGRLSNIEGIVHNIIYSGMPNAADAALGLRCDVKKKKRRKDM